MEWELVHGLFWLIWLLLTSWYLLITVPSTSSISSTGRYSWCVFKSLGHNAFSLSSSHNWAAIISFPWQGDAYRQHRHEPVNSLAPGKFEWNFGPVIFKQILVIDGFGISCEIALIWILHWWSVVGLGLGNQAITWANVDADLCRHMASLGHTELKGNQSPLI